jgi:hypothetical protein
MIERDWPIYLGMIIGICFAIAKYYYGMAYFEMLQHTFTIVFGK